MFRGDRRVILPEFLDDAPPDQAARSLRDLRRINRVFGGHEITRKLFTGLTGPDESFSVLDVGAASGDMGAVIRQRRPAAKVTSFDYRLNHLSGAAGDRVCGDAFLMPFAASSHDFVFCSLFLHHFTNAQVVELLREFGRIARRAVVLSDLERHRLAYWALPLTRWLFHWHPLTMHDGPISVAAAFRAPELRRLAEAAGLKDASVRVHRPAFRLTLTARPA